VTAPAVGVVIAAYNSDRWLAQTLQSVLDQSRPDWFCVVVDDGSTDNTGVLAQRFADADSRFSLITQVNSGVVAARNAGLETVPRTCEFVIFLDADDVWHPDALKVLTAALSSRPDAVGAYGVADYIDSVGNPLQPGAHPRRQRDRREVRGRRLWDVAPTADATFAGMVVAGPIWPPAVAVLRLPAVRAAGGFRDQFQSQEDWELFLRLSRSGPFVATDVLVAYYRRHDSNLSGNHHEVAYLQGLVRRDAYLCSDNTALQSRQIRRAWRYLEIRQSAVLGRHAVGHLAARRWRAAGRYLVGSGLCLASAARFAPTGHQRNLIRLTNPSDQPGTAIPS
jgi:glycosyltransferase involved in cell wall biosynthesis